MTWMTAVVFEGTDAKALHQLLGNAGLPWRFIAQITEDQAERIEDISRDDPMGPQVEITSVSHGTSPKRRGRPPKKEVIER